MNAAHTPIVIDELVGDCEALRLAASWISAEWAAREGYSLQDTESWLAEVAQSADERAFVARVGEKVVGCGALVNNDLPAREDLRPWGACLYVLPEYRAERVGGALMTAIRAAAKSLGYDRLYLWAATDRLVETYQRRGCVEVERRMHTVGPIVILESDLSRDPPAVPARLSRRT